MSTVGLRELRRDASELVRRVETGEEITITVAGRPCARMVPATSQQWRSFEVIADLFDGPPDTTWATDRDRIDHTVRGPWSVE